MDKEMNFNWDNKKQKLFLNHYNAPAFHPMCRCSIITMPEEIYFTYGTKYLIKEYLEENKKGLWTN